MWRSTFVSETIFRRSIRLKQTDRACWTIQTHSDELNWPSRRTCQELNSLSFVCLMKSSTFGPGLSDLERKSATIFMVVEGRFFLTKWRSMLQHFIGSQNKNYIQSCTTGRGGSYLGTHLPLQRTRSCTTGAQLFEGRLVLNPGFFFLCSKASSRIIFSVIVGTSNHQLVYKKN